MMQVILASASPRRKALLEQIGIKPLVQPAAFAESGGCAEHARDIALANAVGKCKAARAADTTGLPIVAADTIVVIDNDVLGKPGDAVEAEQMLARLAGRTHQVMTGVAVYYNGQLLSDVCVTDVTFRALTTAEIAAYVATKEPLDKAGAYGIQGRGAVLVEKIAGCYSNVVGLPLTMLYLMLEKIGARGAMKTSG